MSKSKRNEIRFSLFCFCNLRATAKSLNSPARKSHRNCKRMKIAGSSRRSSLSSTVQRSAAVAAAAVECNCRCCCRCSNEQQRATAAATETTTTSCKTPTKRSEQKSLSKKSGKIATTSQRPTDRVIQSSNNYNYNSNSSSNYNNNNSNNKSQTGNRLRAAAAALTARQLRDLRYD